MCFALFLFCLRDEKEGEKKTILWCCSFSFPFVSETGKTLERVSRRENIFCFVRKIKIPKNKKKREKDTQHIKKEIKKEIKKKKKKRGRETVLRQHHFQNPRFDE